MNLALDNPDRNFSADAPHEDRPTDLRDLLKTSEVAEMFDQEARRRIGNFIGRAVFDPKKQTW
jgi:hypothetical protein